MVSGLFKLWQTQLSFAVLCASSTCGVNVEHLNYKKHSMVRSLYRFHMYYHVRQVLKRLQVPLPYESEFNVSDNPYISEGFSRCARTTTFLMRSIKVLK